MPVTVRGPARSPEVTPGSATAPEAGKGREGPAGVARRGSLAESLKLQSEPSDFPSRNGGRLAAPVAQGLSGKDTPQRASAGPPHSRSCARSHDRGPAARWVSPAS